MKHRNVFLILLFFLLSVGKDASAHALGSSFLHLLEKNQGKFVIDWVPAKTLNYLPKGVDLEFPEHCLRHDLIVDCGSEGFHGNLRVLNLPMHADVVLRIEWLSGRKFTKVLTSTNRAIHIDQKSIKSGDFLQAFSTYFVIGNEHIFLGFDHLLFVAGLILLVGFQRKLIWTITAFTLAHSVTLTLSFLGWVSLPQRAVEIIIALSIVLLATEVMHQRLTMARRWPWLVAFAFGLVHGLGFAGALRKVGVPESDVFSSLFAFNLGVEAGQLIIVALIYAIYRVLANTSFRANYAPTATVVTAYLLGGLGMYWTIDRFMNMFGIV